MSRGIEKVLTSRPTMEGAGVKLRRAFGHRELPALDPFLMLDHFGSKEPDDYILGFPWHPHRGIETVTYMLDGVVEHGDSLGNKGVIGSGDVQWMTAGNGIIHQEMPKRFEGEMRGFQLWVNLPAKRKMMDPRYRDVKSTQIPGVKLAPGVMVKVICGTVEGTKGPVEDLVVDTEYVDVSLKGGKRLERPIRKGNRAFAYVFEGSGYFGPSPGKLLGEGSLVIFKDGDGVEIEAGKEGLRFILVSGKPLREPVAWGGPIVMNTQEELDLAFEEYDNGTFLRHANKQR